MSETLNSKIRLINFVIRAISTNFVMNKLLTH